MNINNTPIVILCGGKGTRMGNISKSIPKTLIKIKDQPIIMIKIKKYYALGFRKFVICIGYKGNLIKRYILNNSYKSSKFYFVNSGLNASMLKRIYDSRKYLKQDFILTYGDTISNLNLKDLLKKSKKSKKLLNLVISKFRNPYGIVKSNKNGDVYTFIEKPVENNYIGYCYINPKSISYINKDMLKMKDSEGLLHFFKILISLNQVSSYCYKGLKLTYNTQEDLNNNFKSI